MNEVRILAVASAIEREREDVFVDRRSGEPLRFDMRTFNNRTICNTFACIAGWTIHLFEPEYYEGPRREPEEKVAARLLSLDQRTADHLFFPGALALRDSSEAVQVLRTLAATGVVDWS